MAKFFQAPEIKSLEELLELVSNPEKVAKHLADMKEMLDAVNGRLGDLDTHEKVIEALNRAVATEERSLETERLAAQVLAKAKSDAGSIIDAANSRAADAKASSDERAESLRVLANELSAREMSVKSREAALDKGEAELSSRLAAVTQREKNMADKELAIAEKARRVAEAAAS